MVSCSHKEAYSSRRMCNNNNNNGNKKYIIKDLWGTTLGLLLNLSLLWGEYRLYFIQEDPETWIIQDLVYNREKLDNLIG